MYHILAIFYLARGDSWPQNTTSGLCATSLWVIVQAHFILRRDSRPSLPVRKNHEHYLYYTLRYCKCLSDARLRRSRARTSWSLLVKCFFASIVRCAESQLLPFTIIINSYIISLLLQFIVCILTYFCAQEAKNRFSTSWSVGVKESLKTPWFYSRLFASLLQM